MDTTCLERFAPWARTELIKGVDQRAYNLAIKPDADNHQPADATVVNGRVLSNLEQRQRAELVRRIEQRGYSVFIEEMAYTWFNRLIAIRYMEVHDYLPSHTRILSSDTGSFESQAVHDVLTLDLEGLVKEQVLTFIEQGDKDNELFRLIVLAQCNELAEAMPTVFGHMDDADVLMLPDNLLKEGSVVAHLVQDIPENVWYDVEALGWLYQFYNAERKDEFFKSKRKATPEDIAPATQLFTPDWIVRYMVDNSLGRLWMLNHPESRLCEYAHAEDPRDRLMEYYIKPDAEHEDFIRVTSPEDITFCDLACGSGHILVYAFKMLMAIYEEQGYRRRDIPELILTKNLSGMEIDPRAAQIETLVLAMCARKHDRRFFSRGVTADITVLESIEIDADSLLLTSPLREKPELLDTLAHLGEIGSLFQPSDSDIAALEEDLTDAIGEDLFSSHTNKLVEQALKVCRALTRHFDVVVANPPYMGSSSFNSFMSKWIKKHYPDSCRDLCTAFIERSYDLAYERGYSAMVTMQSWMFLGSFEKMRTRIIDEKTILTMAHLGTRAFDAIGGEVVSVTADVFYNGKSASKGVYVRLVDIVGSEPKREKLLEAIQNPDCGWFYRADAVTFHDIPGSPIAYWLSPSAVSSFLKFPRLDSIVSLQAGITTGNNQRYILSWWELSICFIDSQCTSVSRVAKEKAWYPCNKGGRFRKWYGNRESVMNFSRSAQNEMRELPGYRPVSLKEQFHSSISWSDITADHNSFRLNGSNCLFEHAGSCAFGKEEDLIAVAGFLNSSTSQALINAMNPTLNCNAGVVSRLPYIVSSPLKISQLVHQCVINARRDYDSQETSWDFKRSPLV